MSASQKKVLPVQKRPSTALQLSPEALLPWAVGVDLMHALEHGASKPVVRLLLKSKVLQGVDAKFVSSQHKNALVEAAECDTLR